MHEVIPATDGMCVERERKEIGDDKDVNEVK
jgi:hypothetical protein